MNSTITKIKIASIEIGTNILPAPFLPFVVPGDEDYRYRLLDIEQYVRSDIDQVLINDMNSESPTCVSTTDHITIYRTEHLNWLYESRKKDARLIISQDYTTAILSHYTDVPAFRQLVQIWLQCVLLQNSIVTLHCACIHKGGFAVAFTGHSGIGKSTRAAHWINHLGYSWLSGDKPAVDPTTAMAFGVPWDGKEQIFINAGLPLKYILCIYRSPETRLRMLSPKQKRDLLVKQLFIPMWDSALTENIFLLLPRISAGIQIYKAFCGHTKEAAAELSNLLSNPASDVLDSISEEFHVDHAYRVKAGNDGYELYLHDQYIDLLIQAEVDLINHTVERISQEDLFWMLENEGIIQNPSDENTYKSSFRSLLARGVIRPV